MQNKILVFGANTYNMLGIVRSLGIAGYKPICVILNSKSGLVYDSKYPQKKVFVENKEKGLEYIIEKFSTENHKPFILTNDDQISSLLDENYDNIKDNFYIFNAGKQGKINQLMDKDVLRILAESHGLKTPKTWLYVKCSKDIPKVTLPCFVKPAKSIIGGKQNQFICNTYEELNKALSTIESEKTLIQELVDKKTEICYSGYAINKGQTTYIPYKSKYLRVGVKSFGGYLVLQKTEEDKMICKINDIIREIGYEGLFSIEFLVDKNNNKYFTEINFRNDGTAFHYVKGGANLSDLYVRSTIGNKIIQLKNLI